MKSPRTGIMHSASLLLLLVIVAVTFSGCSGTPAENPPSLSTPEDIIKFSRLDLLTDEPYFFPPAGPDVPAHTYQVVRKWDMIFVGGLGDAINGQTTNNLIPGKYIHLLVYVGKDAHGNGYAVELNIDTLQISGTALAVDGGIRLFCLGTDYGASVHPTGAHLFNDRYYSIRWAKTVKSPYRQKLILNDTVLTRQVMDDLQARLPYQLEFNPNLVTILFAKKLILVDDGRRNGAQCADYWTSIFEEQAQLCIKGARMPAADIVDYFLYDPVGRNAILPAGLNPFGSGDTRVKDLLEQGFSVVDSPPHQFSCDGSSEQGIVTPTRLFSSQQLEDPVSVTK